MGKTVSSLDLALRTIGNNLHVIIIQFMKGRKDIGEYKIRSRLSPYYEIHQFGSLEFVNLKKPSGHDRQKAIEGLIFADKNLKKKPVLLVLDEINLATAYKLVNINSVLNLLKKIPQETTVVLTGRYAPKEFYEHADFVNEIKIIVILFPNFLRETNFRISTIHFLIILSQHS